MDNIYRTIKDALEQVFGTQEIGIEPVQKDKEPLFLLLTYGNDKVGFAHLFDKPEMEYRTAFENLRELYSIHAVEWANFDLTLVLCKSEGSQANDTLYSNIELDPYFCRKFIIDLSIDLTKELTRLPFVPLRPEKVAELRRPSSAQSFLMENYISSKLAKDLIKPHSKGIERIIRDCMSGSYGEPSVQFTDGGGFPELSHEASLRTRLVEIEICNFRVFKRALKFDLNADLVILYGPNGLGKTSFFDAIDFVCTGGVARFDERFQHNSTRLLAALKNLDSNDDESFVAAKAQINGDELEIRRLLRDRTQAHVNSTLENRLNTLKKLGQLLQESPDLRTDSLVRLFRATHLFGQEYQSLTTEVRKASKIPREIISRMLAFQDYVEGIKKAESLAKDLSKKSVREESKILELTKTLQQKESEMLDLEKIEKMPFESKELKKIWLGLCERIKRHKDITAIIGTQNEAIKKEYIQECRAVVGGEIDSERNRVLLINELEIRSPGYMKTKKESENLLLKLGHENKKSEELEGIYSKVKDEYKDIIGKLEGSKLEFSKVSIKRENLLWLAESKKNYLKIRQRIDVKGKQLEIAKYRIFDQSKKIAVLDLRENTLQNEIEMERKTIIALREKLANIKNARVPSSSYSKNLGLKIEIINSIKLVEDKLSSLKIQLERVNIEHNNEVLLEKKHRHSLEKLQLSNSERSNLTNKIQSYVSSNICPVCGTSHESREILIRRIREQAGKQIDGLQEALLDLRSSETKLTQIKESIDAMRKTIDSSRNDIEQKRSQLLEIENEISSFELEAGPLSIDLSKGNLDDIIQEREQEILNELKKKETSVKEYEEKIEKNKSVKQGLETTQNSYEEKRKVLELEMENLAGTITEIENEILARNLRVHEKEEEIEDEFNLVNIKFENLGKEIEVYKARCEAKKKELELILAKKEKTNNNIDDLLKTISLLKERIDQIVSIASRLGLSSEISIKDIREIREKTEKKIEAFEAIRDELLNLEIVTDNVQLSATLLKKQDENKGIKDELEKHQSNRNNFIDWGKYFEKIQYNLELKQKQAIDNYIKNYGPLTSIVQKRLRPVYSFENINLGSEGKDIMVSVERRGKKGIIPSDYYSESQMQIVMLSLFLSAALTQTWSSFSPILLDDPVQHFDDLNVYSFIDLIKGLLMDEHQFIISTCEDRFFKLMLQKFRNIERRVIFYEFVSIGENGPIVKRL